MNTDNVCPILLNNLPLPYVTEIKHLGNTLQSNGSMTKDVSCKRGKSISKIHSLNQEFHYANTSTVLKLYNIYTCDFYGSNLWDLYSRDVQKLLNSWNIAIRILFDLPIEPISNVPHIKTVLCTRFVQFVTSLLNCQKLCIRLLVDLSNMI